MEEGNIQRKVPGNGLSDPSFWGLIRGDNFDSDTGPLRDADDSAVPENINSQVVSLFCL